MGVFKTAIVPFNICINEIEMIIIITKAGCPNTAGVGVSSHVQKFFTIKGLRNQAPIY